MNSMGSIGIWKGILDGSGLGLLFGFERGEFLFAFSFFLQR